MQGFLVEPGELVLAGVEDLSWSWSSSIARAAVTASATDVCWGAVHLPDNPNFNAIPAIISPGRVPLEECRKWQLVENMAREPLRPGEQAAALLLHRCASALAGSALSYRMKMRQEDIGWRRDQRVAAYEGALRHLLRAADMRCQIGIVDSDGIRCTSTNDEHQREWFGDLAEASSPSMPATTKLGAE
jgi:hypothetical protein